MTTTTDALATIRGYIQAFDFATLFREALGWDNAPGAPLVVTVNTERGPETYELRTVAQKRGAMALRCEPDAKGGVPDYKTRKAIDAQVVRSYREHLIIYTDRDNTMQAWQWVRRQPGKPNAYRESRYYAGNPGDAVAQRLSQLSIDLTEEDTLTLTDVTARLQSFDVDKVTKKFYDRFQAEHKEFLANIQGIASDDDRSWYASLMLNRLMFSYFIQKKGFLAGDDGYLRHKLEQTRARFGPDHFHMFYKAFLLKFFHDGLGTPKDKREEEINALIGDIPYLNGGLFEPHRIEDENTIAIPDATFERVFKFFDDYNWHLDDRPTGKDNEINPDVLGYIFEKYINQKQMGAYYTKEDITGYISRNTIIPFLLEATRAEVKTAFDRGGEVWRLLSDDPDQYIYEAVRRGVDEPLPEDIAAGVTEVAKRGGWNRPTPRDESRFLPTETWREHVVRRQRCHDLRKKLQAGEVHEVNDLITYNLDSVRFARDVIEQCESPAVVRAFWKALEKVSVLDPTCGSGAFLFAALRILEPLYDACLARMAAFVAQFDREGQPRMGHDFRETLAEVQRHPSRAYFIRKRIILRNLYGVDIMEEAVEIAKLRLFLALVSQVERATQIEPLPDIDFNIRAGNTLVGFATLAEAKSAVAGRMFFPMTADQIEDRAQDIAQKVAMFRDQQMKYGGEITPAHKAEIRRDLKAFGHDLDELVAANYGIDEHNIPNSAQLAAKLAAWRASHQPFHWFIEFYDIIQQRGGFDVIIGNPPYVEYSKVRDTYRITGYASESCGNLFAFVMERSFHLTNLSDRIGMIVPVSLLCTDRLIPLQRVAANNNTAWASSYDMRPSSLFSGVSQRLTIALFLRGIADQNLMFGGYRRWSEEERIGLLDLIEYVPFSAKGVEPGYFPKISTSTEAAMLHKMRGPSTATFERSTSLIPVYVHRIVRYFIKALTFVPFFWNESEGEKKSEDYKPFAFDADLSPALAGALNSSTFYWYWHTHSDGFHCGYRDVRSFKFGGPLALRSITALAELNGQYEDTLRRTAKRRVAFSQATGRIEYDELYAKHAKPIIDEIDRVLAEHYGFTEEELDFIINYDIKYRMGAESGDDEGESEA